MSSSAPSAFGRAAGVPRAADGLPWQAICDQASGPVAVLDLYGRYVYANPAFCNLVGYGSTYVFGRTLRDFTHPEDPVIDRDVIDQVTEDPSGRYVAQRRFIRADGQVIWVHITGSIVRDADSPLFFLTQVQDVSAQREAELLWRQTLTSAPIGMALLDLNGRWTEVNDKLCELVGYSREELLAKHFMDLTYPDDQDEGISGLVELVSGRLGAVNLEKRYRHKDGHPLWMLIRSSVVPGPDGEPAFLVSQYEVIGNSRMSDTHLAHMALHDPLTGLANRALLNDRLEHELIDLARGSGVLAVVLADLDGLKRVNDEHGYAAGDQVITAAANELLSAVNPGDTVARLGGDEFVVLTRRVDHADAEAFRDRLAERLQTEVLAAGQRLRLSASVGVATTADPSTTAYTLLHNADRDMYAHKKTGRPDTSTGTRRWPQPRPDR